MPKDEAVENQERANQDDEPDHTQDQMHQSNVVALLYTERKDLTRLCRLVSLLLGGVQQSYH